MATYNGEEYVAEQIQSILSQLEQNDEIIISDDGSCDNTLNIILQFEDARIKLFHNKNHGLIHNFENALKNDIGDYVFLCDQDDIWLPHKVSEMFDALQLYDLVVSDCTVVDKNLNIILESFFKQRSSGEGLLKNLYKNSYLGCCMAFRRKVLEYVLPFPRYIAMHDIWIGLMVELHGTSYFLEKPLMLYRRHGHNASPSSEKSSYSFFYQIRYRIYFIYSLFEKILK